MQKWYWLSLVISLVMLAGLYVVAVPILQHDNTQFLPIHKTLCVDRNISEDQLIIIVGAATEWNYATHGLVSYDIVRLPHKKISSHDSIIIVTVSADFPEIISLDSQNEDQNHLGYYYQRGPIPYIGLVIDRIDDNSFKTVMLHELGHSLGLVHSDPIEGIGTLMYPNIESGSNIITDQDLKQFCSLYGCSANKLHDQ